MHVSILQSKMTTFTTSGVGVQRLRGCLLQRTWLEGRNASSVCSVVTFFHWASQHQRWAGTGAVYFHSSRAFYFIYLFFHRNVWQQFTLGQGRARGCFVGTAGEEAKPEKNGRKHAPSIELGGAEQTCLGSGCKSLLLQSNAYPQRRPTRAKHAQKLTRAFHV